MRLPVYVAGRSSDYQRAKLWIARLEATGFVVVTGDWVSAVEHHGVGNAPRLTSDQRLQHAAADLGGVKASKLVWLLWDAQQSNGRAVEFGYALANGIACIISGDSRGCIFASLAEEHETDQEAFDAIVRLAKGQLQPIAGSEESERP